MYSDVMTDSMRIAIDETNRRRELQRRYNQEHGITPQSVKKNILDFSNQLYQIDAAKLPLAAETADDAFSRGEIQSLIEECTRKMQEAADQMEFEQAAKWRDKTALLRDMDLGLQPASRTLFERANNQEQKPRIRKGPPARYRRKR